MFDADNLVDEFHIEALQCEVTPGNTITKQVCIFFTSSNQLALRLKMDHGIKEISKALDEIKANKDFQMVEHFEERQLVSPKVGDSLLYTKKI